MLLQTMFDAQGSNKKLKKCQLQTFFNFINSGEKSEPGKI